MLGCKGHSNLAASKVHKIVPSGLFIHLANQSIRVKPFILADNKILYLKLERVFAFYWSNTTEPCTQQSRIPSDGSNASCSTQSSGIGVLQFPW